MNDVASFGEWVQKRRNSLGLTRVALADRVVCSPETIKKIERDERRPSSQIAELLAEHLQLPTSEQDKFLDWARGNFVPGFIEPTSGTAGNIPFLPFEAARRTDNLPRRISSFIGREKELQATTGLLDQHPLVMLTGVGGIGKTDLSLQVGQQMLDQFSDGVWLVELAPLADPDRVPQAVLSALGMRPDPTRPTTEVLVDVLANKQCLLILDNCEHVIYAAAALAEALLQRCPNIKILASSREALGASGEMIYQLPSMILPLPSQSISFEEWELFDALRLFAERGTAVLPSFQVTPNNLQAVLKICQRLDGIPLAIELAAARLKILTPEQILERLDNRFRLLTGGRRTALPRQRTLQALIDWSWDLLTDKERLLFQRLSVFAGGMSLDAVEAVCVDSDLESYEVLDLLAELVNKSLVVSQPAQGKEARYHLLETIRQYAQEQLAVCGESEPYRERHLSYFLHFCEQAKPELTGPDQMAWLQRLELEIDNLRHALAWAEETNAEAGLRIIVSSHRFWYEHVLNLESILWLERLRAKGKDAPSRIMVDALNSHGFLIGNIDVGLARTILAKAVAMSRTIDYPYGLGYAVTWLGFLSHDRAGRKELLREGIEIFRAEDDKLGLANALSLAGWLDYLYDYDQSIDFLKEGEMLFREIGHLAGIAFSLMLRGLCEMRLGNLDEAHTLLEEALSRSHELSSFRFSAILNQIGFLHYLRGEYEKAKAVFLQRLSSYDTQASNTVHRSWGYAHLGFTHLKLHEYQLAQNAFHEALSLYELSKMPHLASFIVEGVASMALILEEPELTASLYAWADGRREAFDNLRPPVEEKAVVQEKAAILQLLGEGVYTAAYERGRVMSEDEAMAMVSEITIDE